MVLHGKEKSEYSAADAPGEAEDLLETASVHRSARLRYIGELRPPSSGNARYNEDPRRSQPNDRGFHESQPKRFP